MTDAQGDVRAGLRLVEQLIRLEVARLRANGIPAGQDEYRGLYISDEEVNELLARSSAAGPKAPELDAALVQERAALVQLTQAAEGRLGSLIRIARLDPFEVGCILLALAVEADLRFERLMAYVQDDVTKRRPRVELALRLLAGIVPTGDLRRSLSAAAPLRRLQLVTLQNEPGQPATPLPAQSLVLNPRIAGYLLGQDAMDEALRPHASQWEPPATLEADAIDPSLAGRLSHLAQMPPEALAPSIIHITSHDRTSVAAVAAALVAHNGLRLLAVDFPPLAAALGLETAFMLAEREAALQPAALVLLDLHALKPEDAERLRTRLALPLLAPLVLLASDGRFNWPGLVIPLPAPDYDARRRLWAAGLHRLAPELPAAGLDSLASKFRLSARQIEAALKTAEASALWREPGQPTVTLEDLQAAARSQSTPILSSLARKIEPHFGWDDIILPEDTLAQMHEICAHIEHRHTVYQAWGFDRKMALGRGLTALFAGESGTGKTMAADILAGALGLDLYKIDLSAVVSKYIGETEKNLNHIFSEAETSNAILFFDEADALFGKRSEVKDAHDRYANIETAYLLQKMEEYDGVVVLATNLKMNLDEAFLRRIHFVVDFPLPDEADRRRIWRGAFPHEVPIHADVDLDFMARKFRLSGGHIRNIALAAAFLAASNGRVLVMDHLIQATRREFQKIGRMIHAADFERYYEQERT